MASYGGSIAPHFCGQAAASVPNYASPHKYKYKYLRVQTHTKHAKKEETMIQKYFLLCLETVLVATATATVAASKVQLHHRTLHECVIPLEGPEAEIGAFYANTCTEVDINGYVCELNLPANILQEYEKECVAAGGQYLGMMGFHTTCGAPAVCNPLGGGFCSLHDSTACMYDPTCTWTGSGCVDISGGGCYPVIFDEVWTEHPTCIEASCSCDDSTAASIVREELNAMEDLIHHSYADYSADWTCEDALTRAKCGSGALTKGFVSTVAVIAMLIWKLL